MPAWLGVPSNLSGKVPSDSSSGGVAAFIVMPSLQWGCRDPFKTNGFLLAQSARFLPLEICHTAEMGSQDAFLCLDSEVEFRYYTLPPSFHSRAA